MTIPRVPVVKIKKDLNNSPRGKIIFFPGWGIEAGQYPDYGQEEIVDYGFFANSTVFDFTKPAIPDAEIIIGHSLGACLALQSTLNSSNLKALILFSPFAKFTATEDNPAGQPAKGIRAMMMFLKMSPKKVLQQFYQQLYAPEKSLIEIPETVNKPQLAIGLGLLLKVDLRPDLAKIEIPVLIIQGQEDRIVKPCLAENLAEKLPKAELHLFENAGHALPFTHTTECRELIRDFFDKIG